MIQDQSNETTQSLFNLADKNVSIERSTSDQCFAVLGGDLRQIAMAESMTLDGYTIFATGFSEAEFKGCVQKVSLSDALSQSQYVILPIPVTLDKKTLNAPFSGYPINIGKEFTNMLKGKTIFCGMLKPLCEINPDYKELNITDYSIRNEFCIQNAIATAEGAIEIAMQSFEGTINGSNCLVAGFGRIGKALGHMLKGLNANVSISARKKDDLAWINALGYKEINTNEIAKYQGFDLIFNTIPHLIFNAHTLAKAAAGSIIIDLASAPGGVDFEAADRLGITAIQALSLPGKVAPRAAGQIIKSTIYNIIEEG